MILKLHVGEAKMSVSDVAVLVAASWSHPCTPAERNWVAVANEQTSTRPTESESANLATVAVSRQQHALPAHAQMSFAHDATHHWLPPEPQRTR